MLERVLTHAYVFRHRFCHGPHSPISSVILHLISNLRSLDAVSKRGAIFYTFERNIRSSDYCDKMSLAYLTEKAMLLCNVLRGGDGTKATAATSSPLMNLPFEIREKIWRYVCGDRLIHVTKFPDESRYRGRLRFYNCTSKETEEAIARRFMNRKSLTLSEHADPQAYHVHCSFSKVGEARRISSSNSRGLNHHGVHSAPPLYGDLPPGSHI